MLFAKVKGKDAKGESKKAVLLKALVFIVAETKGPTGSTMAPKPLIDDLIGAEKDLVEVLSQPDGAGNVQVRATATGIAALDATNAIVSEKQARTAAATPAEPSKYTIEKGLELPPSKRGGAFRQSAYPFDAMELKDSFFVAATEARPNVVKGMASTVSGMNKKFAKRGLPNRFTVRARTVADGEKAVGARVYRIA